jgi:DNA-binding NarL/FixJ family response regulator
MTKEIALQLGISPRTVEFHKRTMMKHLEIKTVAELVHYAVTHKIAGKTSPRPLAAFRTMGTDSRD